MKKLRFIAYIFVVIILVSCNNKNNGDNERENPMLMNPWQKFDSTQYNMYLLQLDSLWNNNHSDFLYIEKTGFLKKNFGQIVHMLGTPENIISKELEYGFERVGPHKDFCMFGVTMYVSSEGILAENQRCYRCAMILNTPHSNIMEVSWRDSLQYVELYFLVTAHDTVAFDGFKAGPSFHWLP